MTSNSKLTGTNSKFTKSFYKRPSSFLTDLSAFVNIQFRIIFFMEHLMSIILENPKSRPSMQAVHEGCPRIPLPYRCIQTTQRNILFMVLILMTGKRLTAGRLDKVFPWRPVVECWDSFLLVQFVNSVRRFCFSVQHIPDLVVKYHSKYLDLFGPFQYLFDKQPDFYYLSEKQIDSSHGGFSYRLTWREIFLHYR